MAVTTDPNVPVDWVPPRSGLTPTGAIPSVDWIEELVNEVQGRRRFIGQSDTTFVYVGTDATPGELVGQDDGGLTAIFRNWSADMVFVLLSQLKTSIEFCATNRSTNGLLRWSDVDGTMYSGPNSVDSDILQQSNWPEAVREIRDIVDQLKYKSTLSLSFPNASRTTGLAGDQYNFVDALVPDFTATPGTTGVELDVVPFSATSASEIPGVSPIFWGCGQQAWIARWLNTWGAAGPATLHISIKIVDGTLPSMNPPIDPQVDLNIKVGVVSITEWNAAVAPHTTFDLANDFKDDAVVADDQFELTLPESGSLFIFMQLTGTIPESDRTPGDWNVGDDYVWGIRETGLTDGRGQIIELEW